MFVGHGTAKELGAIRFQGLRPSGPPLHTLKALALSGTQVEGFDPEVPQAG